MSEALYDVIFRGDILPGHQLLQVKLQLQQLFKCDEARIQALFTGGVVPLKRSVDAAAAHRYQQALAAAGADVQMVPAGSVKSAVRRERRSAPGVFNDQAGARRESLKERLAASQAPPAAGSEAPAPSAAARQSDTDEDWSLSPAGSDLLRATERRQQVAADVDTSGLSLRQQQGNLLDEDELPRPSPVSLGQIDFELDEPGADLLRNEEKRVVPPATIELPDVGLAPVGSDLGQLKPAPPPPPPDTSGLMLDPEN